MNARTANEQVNEENTTNFDCFDDDVDHDGNDDDGNNCSVKRSSKDTIINHYGRWSLLDFCFLFDLMIVNGACSMDTDGEFTFVSPNGSGVVDYFLVSKDIKPLCDVKIADHLFSWHLPVEMYWRNDCENKEDSPVSQVGEEKVVWSDAHEEIYRDELNSTEFKECLEKSKDVMETDVHGSVDLFVNALYGAAACMIRTIGKKTKQFNDWFDAECRQQKRLVRRILQSFRRTKTKQAKEEKRQLYVEERKVYVNIRKEKKENTTKKDYKN